MKIGYSAYAAAAFWLGGVCHCANVAEIRVADFDVKVDARADATRGVRAALEAALAVEGEVTMVFEPGEYHFYPEQARALARYVSNHDNSRASRRFVFDIDGARSVTIDGRGARFVMHGDVTPFLIENSVGVRVKNLSIDWAMPLLYEGEVLAADGGGFTVRVRADEPFDVDRGAFVISADGVRWPMDTFCEFAGDGSGQAAGSGDAYGFRYRAEKMDAADGRTVRFAAAGGYKLPHVPKAGNIIFLRCNLRGAPAFFLERSRDVSLEDVTVHHAPGMGLIAQRCEDVTLRRLRVIPNDAKGRQVSTNFDATHFVGCRGRIVIEDGEFRNMLDDAMNVHGVYLQVLRRIDGRRLVARMAHFQAQGFVVVEPGDRMRLARFGTLLPAGEATVTKVERRGPDEMTITFDSPLAAAANPMDALENISWTADVVFRGNRVSGNRARSILASTAGRVVIENNVFNATGSAIRISGDARSWFESGPVTDVLIKGNTFINPLRCGYGRAAIDLDPEIEPPAGGAAEYYHRNIRILENRFRLCDRAVLFARSVDGLEFSGNTMELMRDFPPLGRQKTEFELAQCANVRMEGNAFSGWEGLGGIVLAGDEASLAATRIGPRQNIETRATGKGSQR